MRTITIDMSPVLLGGGDYVLSISVFDDTDPLHINQAKRFDLLARCCDLKIVETDGRESPIFHYPARWRLPLESTPAESAIASESFS
jgi:hypothetical protein